MKLRKESTEYVYVDVTATPVDISLDECFLAFALKGTDPTTWYPATYVAADTNHPSPRLRVLVGPSGAVTLTAGTYTVYGKITDNPEVPVKQASGSLVIE